MKHYRGFLSRRSVSWSRRPPELCSQPGPGSFPQILQSGVEAIVAYRGVRSGAARGPRLRSKAEESAETGRARPILRTVGLAALACLPVLAGAADDTAEYPGLLAEFRQADLIVKVKVTAVARSEDRDPETHTARTLQLRGLVTEVFKGGVRPGDPIDIHVDHADLSRKRNTTYSVGQILYMSSARVGESGIFLLEKGTPHKVINNLNDRYPIRPYVEASIAEGQAAAMALIRLYVRVTLGGEGYDPYTLPRVLALDVKRYYNDLDTETAEFRSLLDEVRVNVLKTLTGDPVDGFSTAVWLVSYMNIDTRKEAVRNLLGNYRRMKAWGDNPPQFYAFGGWQRPMLNAMVLIMEPNWHGRISEDHRPSIIPDAPPLKGVWCDPDLAAKVLAKARAFVGWAHAPV